MFEGARVKESASLPISMQDLSEPDMNTYPTASQATGVARTLSKHSACTIVIYRTPEAKFVTARPTDPMLGCIEGVYRNGYEVPTLLSRTT